MFNQCEGCKKNKLWFKVKKRKFFSNPLKMELESTVKLCRTCLSAIIKTTNENVQRGS
jgi:hypothetical protein